MRRIFICLVLTFAAATVGGCRGGREADLIDGHVQAPLPSPR